MDVRIFISAMALALVARFGLLAWNGYRNGRVKSARPWSASYATRQGQPVIYWFMMGTHLFVVVVALGFGVGGAMGWFPNSN
jgi:hypothetical protein